MFPVINIKANVQWHVRQSATSKVIIAECDPLNLVVEADSTEQLAGVIAESTHLLMLDLLLDNELEQFLRERGWQAHGIPAKVKADEQVLFNLPWQLVAANSTRDSARRAN